MSNLITTLLDLSALENGELTEERIDESVRRILEIKLEME